MSVVPHMAAEAPTVLLLGDQTCVLLLLGQSLYTQFSKVPLYYSIRQTPTVKCTHTHTIGELTWLWRSLATKQLWFPEVYMTFRHPVHFSTFTLKTSANGCSAYYCDNPCAGVQHGRDYCHEGQLASGRRRQFSRLARKPPSSNFVVTTAQFTPEKNVFIYDVMPNWASTVNRSVIRFILVKWWVRK